MAKEDSDGKICAKCNAKWKDGAERCSKCGHDKSAIYLIHTEHMRIIEKIKHARQWSQKNPKPYCIGVILIIVFAIITFLVHPIIGLVVGILGNLAQLVFFPSSENTITEVRG